MNCERCGGYGELGECPQCGCDLEIFLEYYNPDYSFIINCPEVGDLDQINLLEDFIEKLGGEPIFLTERPKIIGDVICLNVAIAKLESDTFQSYLEFRDNTDTYVVFQCAWFPFEYPIPGHVSIWVAKEDLAIVQEHGLPIIDLYGISKESGIYSIQ